MGWGNPVCGTAIAALTPLPLCFVSCAPAATGTAALAWRFNSWLPASITSMDDAMVARALATSGPVWLGLQAPAGAGASPSSWTWVDTKPMSFMDWMPGHPLDHGASGNCATLTTSGWISEPCTMLHAFVVKTPPPP
jgi:hypothetical protein